MYLSKIAFLVVYFNISNLASLVAIVTILLFIAFWVILASIFNLDSIVDVVKVIYSIDF